MKMSEDYQKELVKQNEKILVLLLILIVLIIGFVCLILTTEANKEQSVEVENLYFENISETKEVGKIHTLDESRDNLYLNVNYPEIGYKLVDDKVKDIINNKVESKDKKYNELNDSLTYYYFVDYEVYIGNGNIISLVISDRIDSSDLKNIESNKEIHYFDLNNGKEINRDDILNEGYQDKFNDLNINVDENIFVIQGDTIYFRDIDKKVKLSEVSDYFKIDITDEKIFPNSIKDKSSTVINKEMVVNQDVVMYDRDSLDGNILMTVVKDTKLKVHSNLSNNFSLIFIDGRIGYVETRYLKEVVVVPPVEIPVYDVADTERKTLYIVDTVNVRSQPSTSSTIYGQLYYGDKVTQTGVVSDWVRIEYNGGIAFVKASFTSLTVVKRYTVPVNVPPQSTVDPTKPMVALTFDDGPNNTSTVKILDILEKYNARATFFDLGTLMGRYPDVVRREATLGEVATHTYSHKNLNTLSESELMYELNAAKEAYKDILGVYPTLLRPPYGNANAFVKQKITDMAIINWNVDSLDWKYRNKDLTLNEIYKYGDLNGKIILMHSIHAATAETVEILVPDLINKGYQIVTVSELAKYRGYTLQTGIIYYDFK